MFAEADKNSDGCLTFEEFQEWFQEPEQGKVQMVVSKAAPEATDDEEGARMSFFAEGALRQAASLCGADGTEWWLSAALSVKATGAAAAIARSVTVAAKRALLCGATSDAHRALGLALLLLGDHKVPNGLSDMGLFFIFRYETCAIT